MIGSKLASRYEIVAELGRGGMGVVYRARDPLLNRDVAVKLVPPSLLTPQSEERFQREAQLVAQMDHPSIVPIYDIGRHDGSVFFLMPVIQGRNLRQFLRDKARTLGEILEVGIQVAEALDYSHARGVVHRDIKPENIMVTEEDGGLRVRVMDFGLAKATSEDRITRTGTLIGTVAYFSPEQVTTNQIDGRSDIYSLATVLYECLAGEPPFTGEMQAILYRVVHEYPRPLRTIHAHISEELDAIIQKALSKDPPKRYQRGEELAAALRHFQSKLHDSERGRSIVLSTEMTATYQKPAGAPFVGRASEMAELQRRLNDAVDGECQFVVVAGEPGIGKSRLLEELENLARARKIRVLHGRFVEQDRTFSYQGFCEVIQEYFRSREDGSMSGEQPDLSDLAPDLVALFPVLSEVSEVRAAASDSSASARTEPRKAEDRTFIYELLARTLTRIAGGKPLLLVLENLHGAEMSLDALQYVVRRLGPTPTLIAATFRQTEIDKGHPLVRMLDGFSDDPRFKSIYLGPLTPSEHRDLLVSMIGTGNVSEELAGQLYEATEANPFFTRELVRSLIDSGGIARSETGEWSLSGEMAISRDSLPATIQQAVEKRIERLAPELRDVLSIAAVLGKTFDFRDLEMLGEGTGDLDDAADRLIAEGLLEEERESRGDRLTFASGIVRDVLYNELSRRKRKSLHRRYAQQLEERHGGRLDRIYPQLVYHFSEGDVPEKTVSYGFELARKSIESFAPEETIQVIKTVLEFLEDEEWGPDPALEGEAKMLLASAYRLQGNLDSAFREAEGAVHVFEGANRQTRVVAAALLASEISWQGRRVEETRQWLARGIETARAAGEKESLMHLLSLSATVANLRGEYDRAREHLEEIQRIRGAEGGGQAEEAIPSGGTLTVALANPISAREPSAVGLDEEVEVLALVYETLFSTDDRGHLVPSLCEQWEVSDDARSLSITLRKNVLFHDGIPLVAQHVKDSMERAIRIRKREMSAAFTVISGLDEFLEKKVDDLSGVVVHGEHQLEIRIREPLPIYPAMLADPTTGIARVISDEPASRFDAAAPVTGTGPFRMSGRDGDTVQLERNPTWWRSHKPPLAELKFRSFSSAAGIASELRSGGIDLARDLLPQDFEEILRDGRFRTGLVEAPKKNTYFIVFNVNGPMASNEGLRKILCGTIRPHEIVWRALGRLAQPASGLIPPGILGHDPGKKRSTMNRDQALEMLRAEGIETPLTLKASVHPLLQDRYRSLTSAIFEIWKDLGITVEIATPSMDSFLDSFKESRGLDMIIARWNADFDDPDNFTHGLFGSGNGVYSTYFESAEADELFQAARAEQEPSGRETLYRRFENMALERGVLLPLFHEIDYRVGSPRVRGLQLRGTPPYVNYVEVGRAESETAPAVMPLVRAAGGVLQIPIAEEIESIDPISAGTVERGEVLPNIYESLTKVVDAQVVPWLASEVRVEGGGRRYRFTLRNVQFHNGRRLTARDVRYSWERSLSDPTHGNHWVLAPIRGARKIINGEAEDLEGFRILSASEFVVELEQPMSFFPTILTNPAAAVVQEGTEKLEGSWRETAVGTGPFRVVQFDPGRRLELERNPNYWRPGYPKTEGLVFRFGMSPAQILSEFRAGHLSIASELFPADVDALRHDATYASGYRETPRLSIYLAAFNCNRGPLADPALRRRIVAGIDVAGIVRRSLGRLAIPAHGVIPPGLLGYSPDPISARAIVGSQSDQPELELTALVHPMFAGQYSALARELYELLKKQGIRIRVLNTSIADYVEKVTAGEGDLVIGRWIGDFPDADTFVHGLLYREGGFVGRYSGVPEIDRLAEQARIEIDPGARHSLYRKVEETIQREALLLPLLHEQVYRFARPEVEGLSLSFSLPEVAYETLQIRR